MAGGGRLNDFSVEDMGELSLPLISVEAAGVGGRLIRGMMKKKEEEKNFYKKASCFRGQILGVGVRIEKRLSR